MPWTHFAGAEALPLLGDLARTDAYCVWAEATGYRDHVDAAGQVAQSVAVLLELAPDATGGFDAARRWLTEAAAVGMLTVPPLHLQGTHHHVTASVTGRRLDVLRNAHVRRFEMGLPLSVPGAQVATAPAGSAPARARSRGQAAAGGQNITPVVIGVVDDGCAFAHPAFADAAGKPRLLALWDQGSDAAAPWSVPADLQHGAELGREQLRMLAAAGVGNPREPYRAAGRSGLPDAALLHGTCVLDVCAGHPNPLLESAQPRDAAALSDLVFVQIPRAGFDDVSGAWLCVHLLDAVHYILARAGPQARVVVNISLGAFAGPHDGSTLLERALDELIESEAGRLAIIVAAGNGREQAVHARLQVPAARRAAGGATEPGRATLLWDLSHRDPTPSFLEVWYPPQGPPLRARATPCVEPEPTDRWVDAGQAALWRSAWTTDEASCGVALVHADRTANGDRRLVLMTVAATLDRGGGRSSMAHNGVYRLELCNQGDAPVEVEAWIERDDPSPADSGSARWQSSLAPAQAVEPSNTLSSIASGRCTVVVGAADADSGAVAGYSGEGPRGCVGGAGRRAGPDLLAPGQRSDETAYQTAGATPARRQWLQGTSVAAAVVTRRVAALLAQASEPLTHERLKARLAGDKGAAAASSRSGRAMLAPDGSVDPREPIE